MRGVLPRFCCVSIEGREIKERIILPEDVYCLELYMFQLSINERGDDITLGFFLEKFILVESVEKIIGNYSELSSLVTKMVNILHNLTKPNARPPDWS